MGMASAVQWGSCPLTGCPLLRSSLEPDPSSGEGGPSSRTAKPSRTAFSNGRDGIQSGSATGTSGNPGPHWVPFAEPHPDSLPASCVLRPGVLFIPLPQGEQAGPTWSSQGPQGASGAVLTPVFGDSLLKCGEPRLEAGWHQDVSPLCCTGTRAAGAKCWVHS